MVFRTVGAIATLVIGLGGAGGQALAQHYPPPEAYLPQAYPPPQGYAPRQPLPSVGDADDDAPPLNAPVLQGPPLPPVNVGPLANEPPASTRYGPGTPAYPADAAPPSGGYRSAPQGYEPAIGTNPYYGVPGAIPPGPAGSAKQDAIRQEAMRPPLPISPDQIGPGPAYPAAGTQPPSDSGDGYRSVQSPQGYEPALAGTHPSYRVPGAIPPGPAGSAEQDAIRQEAMRRPPLPITPGQIGPTPDDPRVTGSIGGGDPRTMAAFPPDVRPETGPKKELPPQFRRTLVDYYTKEPAGTIIIDTPNTYLYLVLANGKALRYGIGVGREGFTWSGVQQVTRMAEWPDWNPPEEMIVRQPYLPRFMAGGETNPLGARALYLGKTVYRIHGTNQPSTIGTFVSSGCIRLTNEDVMDLYSRVKVGTRVVVLPGRPPATEAGMRLAPPAGASVLPSGGSVAIAPLGPPPSAMAR
jgi:lipoprotein-anchoring transpeptidase ErfK/SrfK